MTVSELIELLEPHKSNINDIIGLDHFELLVEYGKVSFIGFKIGYQCDNCANVDYEGSEDES